MTEQMPQEINQKAVMFDAARAAYSMGGPDDERRVHVGNEYFAEEQDVDVSVRNGSTDVNYAVQGSDGKDPSAVLTIENPDSTTRYGIGKPDSLAIPFRSESPNHANFDKLLLETSKIENGQKVVTKERPATEKTFKALSRLAVYHANKK
jgi:hypothetical protein